MNQRHIDSTDVKILIVDDQLENLEILRQTLESEGYQVSAVPSGAIALKITPEVKLDLALLDILMPGMNGFETYRQLREDDVTADTPIIFITAKDEAESVIEGFEVGAVDYITKPFRTKEALLRVEAHLKNARLAQALRHKNRELQQEIAKRERAENVLQTADEQLSLISERGAERWGIAGFVGQSETLDEILVNIRRLQKAEGTSVLITGENGTGKELIAHAIHLTDT